MKNVGPDELVYSYSARNPVALRVSSGEVFSMETHDRFSGVEDLSNILSADTSRLNAVTGAVYVEGAEPGRVLQVDILDIALTLGHGFTFAVPGRGAFGERLEETVFRRVPIRGSFALYAEDIPVPLAPHVGRIGVAPEGEDVPCSTPGPHGGNLDNNQLQGGSSAFFPIFHPGALLALGDIHAAQGDGESALSGIETAGLVTLRCDVRKDLSLSYPLATTRDEVMLMADGATLDEAARTGLHHAALLLKERRGLTYGEAAMLVSIAGDLRVCQVVNPRVGVKVAFRRNILDIN